MRRLTASLCLALLPITASAQVLGDPDVIEILLKDAGMPVVRDTDSFGDPLIRSAADDIRFSISFYDCDDGPCDSLLFYAGFDSPRPRNLTLVNDWNRDYRFARAYLDTEGDPVIEMDVSLGADGIGRRNFNSILDSWKSLLSGFRDHINW